MGNHSKCKGLALLSTSPQKLPRQDLNLNKESQNLNAPNDKSISVHALYEVASAGCSAGCSDQRTEGCITDHELARVVAAWPDLPEPIRRAVLAMIEAAGMK